MKKWLCVLAAVWMMISAMAVASAEPGYEFVKRLLEDSRFLGNYDYSLPASGEGYSEEYSDFMQSLREITDEDGTLVFMNIDCSKGELAILGQNKDGVEEYTAWSGLEDMKVYGMLYVFSLQYDDIVSRIDDGSFIIVYMFGDGDSDIIQDSQTAAVVAAALAEANGM